MYQKYQSFLHGEDELRVRILALEGRWLQIEAQVEYLKQIWSSLPARLQIHFNHVMSILQALLLKAASMVDALINSTTAVPKDGVSTFLAAIRKEGKLRRGAFAVTQKDALDKLIEELKTWHQDMLGPSWFQLLRLPGALVKEPSAKALASAPQLVELQRMHKNIIAINEDKAGPSADVLLSASSIGTVQTPVFASTVATCCLIKSGQDAIMDKITLPNGIDNSGTTKNFCGLARKLSAVDPSSMNLLQCEGLIEPTTGSSAHDDNALLFRIPDGHSSPRSLREVLLEQDPLFPLHARISIAAQLARSVISVHSLEIVHKNIRPETILAFSCDLDLTVRVFTLGFEQFRAVDAPSLYRGDFDWRKALYRHPSRHGTHPETQYLMQHDIYSLGVCLLEIGLWKSFVLDPGRTGRPLPNLDMSRIRGREADRKAHVVKERLQELARLELPGRMGRKYTEVVLSCLSCLDRNNAEFGNKEEFEDDNEILVSVRFMEKVSRGPAPLEAIKYADKRQVILQLQEITV
ncbi:hypothetical protein LTR70_002781 [Exophiala xenobiotica]|uniref:Protein kinase domain-containing protein n=1 Tax=Lithohypha guttulata TaxID=1690604 RepID=A0ABR0KJ60_9EURO|nr:hypothetical protein LTR24_001995 [Lithohypha guttulata]KAK5324498.1 hypothetical protein LTR70_002781 [Exophiala xenobiotica]